MMKNQIYKFSFLASILLISTFSNIVKSWSYPLKNITITNCENCTIELPKIKNADYYSYKNSAIYRKVYSMLRLSTYYGGRDSWIWSHQWVDIATALWTPVYSIYDWIVIIAGEKWDRWNVIVVQHEWNWEYYYSVYAHLSEIKVQVWNYISEWDEIWATGESGNATWPHLHLQIEKNQTWKHPFFPSWCEWTIDEIVNEWNCIQQIKNNTVDPIVFLEQTVKLTALSWETEDGLYVSPSSIKISGFKWWFLKLNSVQKINIIQSISGNKFLLNPIQVYTDSKYITITPSKIQTLVGDRTLFVQAKNQTWITIITIKYWEITLARFPVLIWTAEEILLRKENAALMEALQELWVNID